MDTDIKLRERNRGTTATRENQEVSSFDLTFSDLSYTVGKGKKMFKVTPISPRQPGGANVKMYCFPPAAGGC